MRLFYSLCFAVGVLLAACFPLSSSAAVPTATSYDFLGYSSTDPISACSAYVASSSTIMGPVGIYTNNNGQLSCSYRRASDGAGLGGPFSISSVCPSGSTKSGSTCTCNPGYVEDPTKTSCISQATANCSAVSGQIAGSINSPYTPGAPLNSGSTSLCDPGSAITGGSTCAVSVSYDFATQVGTSWIKQGTGTFTGTPCTESSAAPTPQPPTSSPTAAPTINPCSPGSVPGTVNGQSVCSPVADRNVVAAGPTSTASAPSGSAGLLPNAPPTAVKSTEQTTCTGGNCVTTKTYTDSAGVIVGTASKQQSQGGFCAENPGASVCQSSATDTPLPAQPKLYEPEFPDGLAGVWETRKAELTASPLLSIVPSLMPNVGGGGTCPNWNIDLDVGIGNYGVHNVAPPCWLWDVAKAIVIISSLLLARALVFGG